MVSGKGYAFKVLPPKDISSVLGLIGAQQLADKSALVKPTPEIALSAFQSLAQFAYDTDGAQVRAQISRFAEVVQIFDDATDVLTVFKLTRQLAALNMVEDVGLRDVWEPESKRFRALLSGMINFCRYKEAKSTVVVDMQEELGAMRSKRSELFRRCDLSERELAAAEQRSGVQPQEQAAAEGAQREAEAAAEGARQQHRLATRALEEKEALLSEAQKRAADQELQLDERWRQRDELRDRVSESPEALAEEVRQLHAAVGQQRAKLDERAAERRSKAQRGLALGRLAARLEACRGDLAGAHEAAHRAAAATSGGSAAREEAAAVKSALAAQRAEEAALARQVAQTQAELEAAKGAHEARLRELEERRSVAIDRRREMRAASSKEESSLRAQCFDLDAEVTAARRAHESEVDDLRAQLRRLCDDAAAYVDCVESERAGLRPAAAAAVVMA